METRVKKLETIVGRLSRRQRNKIKAIITPYPISNCVIGEGVEGHILKYMFCCPGTIIKGGVFLNKKPKFGASIVVTIESDQGSNTKSFMMTRKNIIIKPDIEISTWDRMTVSFFVIDPKEDKINEVWVSFLWTPKVGDASIKNFLISELEKDVPEE